MKSLAAKVVSAMILVSACYTNLFAYSDPDLIAIRDAFNGRRDQMISSQVSSPYTDPCDPDTGTAVWGLNDYAISALYQRDANATQIAKANRSIQDACWRAKKDNSYYTGLDQESFHWVGNQFFRIYEMFNHNVADANFRRLTPAAEAAIYDVFWNYSKWNSVVADANTTVTKTWYIWGSENHDMMRKSTNYSAAAILKDVAPYNTYTFNDGKTALQHYNAWNTYFKEYLRERAKKGLFVEIASPTYFKYTCQGLYNFYDFAQDPNLSRLGGMTLDLWWADWAHEQYNGVRGGGKARCYQDRPADGLTTGADLHPSDDGAYSLCWYYFGFGNVKDKAPSTMCMATSKYRLPLVVMDLALDVSGRGTYELKSRRPGLSLLPPPAGLADDMYALDPNYGGIYKYTYTTPSFIIGSLMLEKRSANDWSDISFQNRFQGVIFNSGVDARIIPQCVGPLTSSSVSGKTWNQQWSVQNKGTLIVQRINFGSTIAGDMRVYIPHKYLTSVIEDSNWIFATAGNAYAAVRPAWGGYNWATIDYPDGTNYVTHADPNWIRCNDRTSPVIIEVAESKDYANFEAFKTAVKALPLTVVNNVLTYTGLKDNGTFTFYTNASTLPQINGVPINLKPTFTFDSPFMHEDWASGNVVIRKSGRTCELDFNNAVKNEYGCGQWGYLAGDLNKDCSVDILDIKIIADNWLGFDSWLGQINPLPSFDYGPYADSSTTVALWHMDSLYSGTDGIWRVADDDTVNTSRNNNLRLGYSAASPPYSSATRPTISIPDPGYNNQGACLVFDGVNDECLSDVTWAGYNSVLVDAWFNTATTAGTQVIVEASSTWSLSVGLGKLGFTTWHGVPASDSLSFSTVVGLNTWHHVQAICTAQGKKYLTLDGTTITSSPNAPITSQTKSITVGNKPGNTRFFNGRIDEIRVATIDPQGYRSGTVNMRDLAIIGQDWWECTDPADPTCVHAP